MSELFLFEHLIIGDKKLHVVTIENDPWFLEIDICDILLYKNNRDAVKKHVLPEFKKYVSDSTELSEYLEIIPNLAPNSVFINEAGLYSLIMRSKMSTAIEFQKWVVSDVRSSFNP